MRSIYHFNRFQCTFSGGKHMHIAVQLPPLSIFQNFSSSSRNSVPAAHKLLIPDSGPSPTFYFLSLWM